MSSTRAFMPERVSDAVVPGTLGGLPRAMAPMVRPRMLETKRGQTMLEFLLLLGFILIVLLVSASMMGFFSNPSDMKIANSESYWKSVTPIKLQEWSLSTATSVDGSETESHLAMKIKNPSAESLTLRKISIDKGNFINIWYSNNVYAGRADNLSITINPGAEITLIAQHYGGAGAYIPPSVYELGIKFTYDSNIPSQTETGAVPIMGKPGIFAPGTNGLLDTGGRGAGCGSGTTACPDTNHCVPSACCIGGTSCVSPKTVCNGACCDSSQTCLNNACSSNPSVDCSSPNRICGPSAGGSACGGANAYDCCTPSDACINGQCLTCNPPTSVACNTKCCADGSKCIWASSTCIASCDAPNFLCPSGSTNCCNAASTPYCNPISGACAASCSLPSGLSCGPDANGINYCCSASKQICNATTKQCNNCISPTSVACNSVCCGDNFDCNYTTSACSCPPERSYSDGITTKCCPLGKRFNPATLSCEICPPNTVSCGQYCCPPPSAPSNLTCDISKMPVYCINCCSTPNTFNCNNSYCCNTSQICTNSHCINACTAPQIACPQLNGAQPLCCQSTDLCDMSTHACLPEIACQQSNKCGTFCCADNTFCYNGSCTQTLPTPAVCSYASTCPPSQVCNYVDVSTGIRSAICCASNEYCSNTTSAACCSNPTCDITNSSGTYKFCCGAGEGCKQDTSNPPQNLCCAHTTSMTYSQESGTGKYSSSLSNDCSGICCSTDPYNSSCLNDNSCCNNSQVCLTGTPGHDNPFERMSFACCSSDKFCGTLKSDSIETQTSLCCSQNRSCNVPANSPDIAYTCCGADESCTNGNFCCPTANVCKGSEDASSTCCTGGQSCLDTSVDSDGKHKVCCTKDKLALGAGCCTNGTIACTDAGDHLCYDASLGYYCAQVCGGGGGNPHYATLCCEQTSCDSGYKKCSSGDSSDSMAYCVPDPPGTCSPGTPGAKALTCTACSDPAGWCDTTSGTECCNPSTSCVATVPPDNTGKVCCATQAGYTVCTNAPATCCPVARQNPPSPIACTNCCSPNEMSRPITQLPNTYACCQQTPTDQYASGQPRGSLDPNVIGQCCAAGTIQCTGLDSKSECCPTGSVCTNTQDPITGSYCCGSGSLCLIGGEEQCCGASTYCLPQQIDPNSQTTDGNVCCAMANSCPTSMTVAPFTPFLSGPRLCCSALATCAPTLGTDPTDPANYLCCPTTPVNRVCPQGGGVICCPPNMHCSLISSQCVP